MQKRYIILAIFFIAIASGLLFLPDMRQKDQIPAEEFLNAIHSNNRFISSDNLAKRIIEDDPIVFLVDVRTPQEFDKYSLPGAINIPMNELLNDDWAGYLDQDILDVIFYANGDALSEEAWGLCKQLGYNNLYVLEGGLNRWFETIMQPQKPDELASNAEFDLYSFRMGASIYFGSGSVTVATESVEKPAKKKTIPIKKKVKKEAEGGC